MRKLKNLVVKIWPFSKMQKKLNFLADKIIVLESKVNACNHFLETKEKEKNILLANIEDLKSRLTNYNIQLEAEIQEKNVLYDKILICKNDAELNLKKIQELTDKNKELNEDIKLLNDKNKKLDDKLKALQIQYNIHEPGVIQSSSEFWNKHYIQGGNSGTGSYSRLAEFKADIINSFIESNNINTAIELGCGDGNQLSMIKYHFYTGIDVSEYIINQNRKRFSHKENYNFFCSLTERENYIYKKFDLSISMDVIFHLLEDDVYEKYMKDLFNLSNNYVIIYSSNHEEYTPWPEYRHRNFLYYVQNNLNSEWELIDFIPNRYPYIIGNEEETSASDFFVFKKIS